MTWRTTSVGPYPHKPLEHRLEIKATIPNLRAHGPPSLHSVVWRPISQCRGPAIRGDGVPRGALRNVGERLEVGRLHLSAKSRDAIFQTRVFEIHFIEVGAGALQLVSRCVYMYGDY